MHHHDPKRGFYRVPQADCPGMKILFRGCFGGCDIFFCEGCVGGGISDTIPGNIPYHTIPLIGGVDRKQNHSLTAEGSSHVCLK